MTNLSQEPKINHKSFGAEIYIGKKRPWWLQDHETHHLMFFSLHDNSWYIPQSCDPLWDQVSHIKLHIDHPYYKAQSFGYMYVPSDIQNIPLSIVTSIKRTSIRNNGYIDVLNQDCSTVRTNLFDHAGNFLLDNLKNIEGFIGIEIWYEDHIDAPDPQDSSENTYPEKQPEQWAIDKVRAIMGRVPIQKDVPWQMTHPDGSLVVAIDKKENMLTGGIHHPDQVMMEFARYIQNNEPDPRILLGRKIINECIHGVSDKIANGDYDSGSMMTVALRLIDLLENEANRSIIYG